MKRLIILLCLTAGFCSCQSDTIENPSNGTTLSVNEFLRNPSGFNMNKLIEEGTNNTSPVDTYLFLFSENGKVTASGTSEMITGNYLVFRDENRTVLRIIFPDNGIHSELSDDWYFITQNTNSIRFEDHGDVIQFKKK